jgi:hypothetical protein
MEPLAGTTATTPTSAPPTPRLEGRSMTRQLILDAIVGPTCEIEDRKTIEKDLVLRDVCERYLAAWVRLHADLTILAKLATRLASERALAVAA